MNQQAVVIFGATGDLCFNKLLPALATLIKTEPSRLDAIVLVGRQVKNIQEYERLSQEKGLDQHDWEVLKSKLQYVFMQSTDGNDYGSLQDILHSFHHRFFYVATPPSMYHVILENLVKASLFEKHHAHHRIAFEKPFGENGMSAKILSDLVHHYSDEEQIFRVDHYLAKPLIRELLSLRSSLPEWNTRLQTPELKKVVVTAFETLGIIARGKFYDQTGAIHDMIQSHLLETLALAVMPLPQTMDVTSIQQAKVDFFHALSVIPDSIILGQYADYRNELHIQPDSLTETFAKVVFQSSLPWLSNVEFIIQTGKRLSQKRTEIEFYFDAYRIVLNVSPLLKVKVIMHADNSVLHSDLNALKARTFMNEDAYVKIFKDFLDNDQTLFPSAQEIEATWRLVDVIKQARILPKLYRHENDLLGEHNE